ncbi:hypothetical protein QTJ16_005941 [Diplocarpon rosae]|uniref:Uncharacterized protein n=1 Tax=Diplocarpon rosae TaxID=946125 RepID=A0AAD9SX67_9HELO|nr:hypothetical protein QTJ16_005941 [Diplocarpon rosae]
MAHGEQAKGPEFFSMPIQNTATSASSLDLAIDFLYRGLWSSFAMATSTAHRLIGQIIDLLFPSHHASS